jgi:hypothetical protein
MCSPKGKIRKERNRKRNEEKEIRAGAMRARSFPREEEGAGIEGKERKRKKGNGISYRAVGSSGIPCSVSSL